MRSNQDFQREFTLTEIANLLAIHFNVPHDEQSKFLARMRNFLRLGWPAIDRQKGKASKFNFSECLDFALAMEFSNAGFPPERCIDLITFNRERKGSPMYHQSGSFYIPSALGFSTNVYTLDIDMAAHWEAFA